MTINHVDTAVIAHCREIKPEAASDDEAVNLVCADLYNDIKSGPGSMLQYEVEVLRFNYLRSIYNKLRNLDSKGTTVIMISRN